MIFSFQIKHTCTNHRKDYECNRLTSGILQLSKDTHLVLDETQMQQGRLDAAGVGNITALGSLIKTQKVEYDFKYYKMEFDSDISVLILSEGKSLLPVSRRTRRHFYTIFTLSPCAESRVTARSSLFILMSKISKFSSELK